LPVVSRHITAALLTMQKGCQLLVARRGPGKAAAKTL